MAKIYIDFDSTLYDTDKMRKYNKDIAVVLSEHTKLSLELAEREVDEAMQSKSKRKVFDVCEDLEKKYALEKDCLKKWLLLKVKTVLGLDCLCLILILGLILMVI